MTKMEQVNSAIKKTKSALTAADKITDDPMVISSLEMALEILEIVKQEIITGVPYA